MDKGSTLFLKCGVRGLGGGGKALYGIFSVIHFLYPDPLHSQKAQQIATHTTSGQSMSDVPLGPKIASACCGSLITSVVVNPFDVIRVRMQQDSALNPIHGLENARPVTRVPMLDSSKLIMDSLPNNPCDPKVCCKSPFWYPSTIEYCHTPDLGCTRGRMPGTVGLMVTISRDEGVWTLWRGLSLQLIQSVPANVVYFIAYEHLRDSMPFQYPLATPLLAGGAARALASTVVSPLELFKTRIQSINSPQAYSIALRSIRKAVKMDGVRSLWSGLGLTLFRDIPFSSIYWAVVEVIRGHLPRKSNSHKEALFQSFVAGTFGGATAALVTTPFDVAKTRRQLCHYSSESAHMRITSFMGHIIKTEGWQALFVGLTPRLLKVAPACAIMISSYETGKLIFNNSLKN